MFLVRRAGDVMEKDVTLLAADADFDAFLRQHGDEHGFRHVVVTRGNHIAGVVRVNTSLRRGIEQAYSGVRLGDVAQRNFTLARESDIMFDVVQRMTHHDAAWRSSSRIEGRGRPVGYRRHDLQGPDRRFGRRQHQAIQLMIAPRYSSESNSQEPPAIQPARCDFRNTSVAARSTAPPEITTP